MKVKTSTAARLLSVHPSHLLLHVAELDAELKFEDVWPEIDQTFVDVLSVSTEHRPAEGVATTAPALETVKASTLGFPDAAARVADRLFMRGNWGGASVSFEAIVNMTHLPSQDVDKAITELRKKHLLDRDGTGRARYSLNPAKRNEIESLHQQVLEATQEAKRRKTRTST